MVVGSYHRDHCGRPGGDPSLVCSPLRDKPKKKKKDTELTRQ